MSEGGPAFDTDLLVIGGGSGGVRAARMAAERGIRVTLVEAGGISNLGGTCVNAGCIPKKLYSYAAHYSQAFEESRGFGWDAATPRLDWGRLKQNRRAELSRLNGVYQSLLVDSGVQVAYGRASLVGANAVRIDGDDSSAQVTARHILVATGGRPQLLEVPGREHILTSNEMFDLDPFPERLLVIGGGYIACEFASIFNGLGSQVTLLHRGSQLLRGFDADVGRFVGAEMAKKGIDLRFDAGILSVQRTAGGLLARLRDGGSLVVDAILGATGRVPNVEGLRLEAAGVAQGAHGAVRVDGNYRTSVPSIYAVGDVTARLQLTPIALAEAMVVVDRLLGPVTGKTPRALSYEFIPTAVFTDPAVGTVGMTETEARDEFGAVSLYRGEFKALRHTLSGSRERTMMKLVVDSATDRVVGLHMVGPDAGEIVQGFAVALKAGATKATFDTTIGVHPTVAEEFLTLREPVAGP